MRQQLQDLPVEYFEQRPAQVHLQAVQESFIVRYQTAPRARIAIDESDKELRVYGPIDDTAACASALRAWLRAKARRQLAPWLGQTSEDSGLPYAKITVRSQRSRWGSCSRRGFISLNCKFLPPAQVHYLFVHELCHTRHLNHSARYWALVERKLPDYRDHEVALRAAWRYVPRWAGE